MASLVSSIRDVKKNVKGFFLGGLWAVASELVGQNCCSSRENPLRRRATATPFVRGGRGGARRRATATPFSTEGHGGARRRATATPFVRGGRGGARRRATATPFSTEDTEGRGGGQLQLLFPRRVRRGAENCGDILGWGWVGFGRFGARARGSCFLWVNARRVCWRGGGARGAAAGGKAAAAGSFFGLGNWRFCARLTRRRR